MNFQQEKAEKKKQEKSKENKERITTTTARAKMALKPESWELCGKRG